MLETVCKHILEDAPKPYPDDADLPKLRALTAELMNLAPNQHQKPGGAAMTAEVDHILGAASEGPFIFNRGHSIDKATPPDHVAALVEQVIGLRRGV